MNHISRCRQTIASLACLGLLAMTSATAFDKTDRRTIDAASHDSKGRRVSVEPIDAKATAYIVAEIRITDPERYRSYVAAVTPLVAKHGGTYLARGGETTPVEGRPPDGRIVILAFPDLTAARAFLAAPEYQPVVALRHQAATSRVYIVEGVAP